MSYSSLKTIKRQGIYEAGIHLNTKTLSYQELLRSSASTAIILNQLNVYNAYMYHLKLRCLKVYMTEEQAKKFAYKPKLLAHQLYGNVNFYTLILRLNNMISVNEFTEARLVEGIIVPGNEISDFLDEVLIKEKSAINRNLAQITNDVNSLT